MSAPHRGLQRRDFRMVGAASHMPPFADHLAALHDDRADWRIRARMATRLAGQRQRAPHEADLIRLR